MPSLPWFPFYFQDFQLSKKVRKMSNEQKGAYLTLLVENWSEPAFCLPMRASDLRTLANWKGSQKDFKLVRACFLPHPEQPGKLYNPRLYKEWIKAEGKRQAAKVSAHTRWQKPPLNGPSNTPSKPIRTATDCTSKGLEPVSSEVGKIADKWFPPTS